MTSSLCMAALAFFLMTSILYSQAYGTETDLEREGLNGPVKLIVIHDDLKNDDRWYVESYNENIDSIFYTMQGFRAMEVDTMEGFSTDEAFLKSATTYEYTFNENNQLATKTAFIVPHAYSSNSTYTITTKYYYTSEGEIKTVETYRNTSEPPPEKIADYTYDSFGRINEIAYWKRNHYDADGNANGDPVKEIVKKSFVYDTVYGYGHSQYFRTTITNYAKNPNETEIEIALYDDNYMAICSTRFPIAHDKYTYTIDSYQYDRYRNPVRHYLATASTQPAMDFCLRRDEDCDMVMEYLYDDHGNWTTKIVKEREGTEFKVLRTITREITYYE